jgi:hypothetical protein
MSLSPEGVVFDRFVKPYILVNTGFDPEGTISSYPMFFREVTSWNSD